MLQKSGCCAFARWHGDVRMYAFLLILGAVITAAGLALVASGVSIQEHTFDASNVTPGAVAVIGGCILIGLAFVVRALLRVERALMVRPIPRVARPSEAVDAAPAAAPAAALAPAVQPAEPARVPFPSRPKTAPTPQPAAASAEARTAPSEPPALDSLRVPTPERLENAPMVEESDVSLLPKAPARSDEETGEVGHGVVGRTNGAAHGKTVPQVAVSARPAQRPQQQQTNSIFDSLWPKPQRPAQEAHPEAHPTPAAQAAPPPSAPEAQPAQGGAPAPQPPALPQELPPAVSILKSGVVEGMAYTLYSDGSIEAQLPGGTLRFGSITELRNHIEQNG